MNLDPLVRTLRPQDLVAYAGATWDHHRMHHDAAYAAAHGLRAPVVDGQMLGALMAAQVTRHFGPDAFLARLAFRLRSMVFAGDTVMCEGSVVSDDGATTEVSLRVLVGDEPAADGSATVRLGGGAPR